MQNAKRILVFIFKILSNIVVSSVSFLIRQNGEIASIGFIFQKRAKKLNSSKNIFCSLKSLLRGYFVGYLLYMLMLQLVDKLLLLKFIRIYSIYESINLSLTSFVWKMTFSRNVQKKFILFAKNGTS